MLRIGGSYFKGCVVYSTFRLLPLGAGAIRGVYVTVRVTTSRMCRTLVLDFCFFSAKRALRAASQSKTELGTGRALKGDRAVEAVNGESKLETVGLGGILRLGKEAAPVGGADMGAEDG